MMVERVWVFDLDDTLYAEYDYMVSGYQHIISLVQQVYGKAINVELLLQWWHEDRNSVFQRLVEQIGLPLSVIESLVWAYRNHQPNIALYPDAALLIKQIQGKEPYFIVTDGRSMAQRFKVLSLELAPEQLFVSEELGESKPYTSAFDSIQQRYTNANILYFADNPKKDFIRPNQLGWQTFGMLDRGKNIHAQDVQLDQTLLPQRWIKSLDDIAR